VTQLDALLDQRLLERKRAAERKTDQVVAPDLGDFGWLLNQFTIAPDPVSRQISADVEIVPKRRQARVAGLGHGQHRAGFGVGLGKAQKIVGQRLGQDHEVGLHIAGGEPGGGAGQFAAAAAPPGAGSGLDALLGCCTHRSILYTCKILLRRVGGQNNDRSRKSQSVRSAQ
jgi:hypothetical protein